MEVLDGWASRDLEIRPGPPSNTHIPLTLRISLITRINFMESILGVMFLLAKLVGIIKLRHKHEGLEEYLEDSFIANDHT